MNRIPTQHYPDPASRYPPWPTEPPLGHVLASASRVLEQPPPPSLRDVLGAYKANGDGDREVLLAVLKAKTSEDNRQAALAALHEQMLQMQRLPLHQHPHHAHPHAHQPYPTPAYTQLHSPESRPARSHYHHSVSSRSHSPPPRSISPRADHQHRRKRARGSQSPPPHHHPYPAHREIAGPPSHAPGQGPPSPYSSSADSPRSGSGSRGSMTIGSLLAADPAAAAAAAAALGEADRERERPQSTSER